VDHPRSKPGYEQADLALLLAARAWGLPDCSAASAAVWDRLDERWAQRLRVAEQHQVRTSPSQALDQLRESLRQQSRANLDEVHPSWWIRALQDESPAVRQVVCALGTPRVSQAAHTALHMPIGDVPGIGLPDPQVAGWVMALWSERLVGGEPVSDHDPPVIVALGGLAPAQLYRLASHIGLAKLVLAEDPEGVLLRHPFWRARGDWYRQWLDARFQSDPLAARALAARDLSRDANPQRLTDRRRLATIGLTALARLLVPAEAFRVRWSLQHVPYPIAKQIRLIMARKPEITPAAFESEATVLEAAWSRLSLEGRISRPHPDVERRSGDVA
jgi:hypothetical protein